MLLGRLEKDGSRKVGIYFDLPLSHLLCDCCVSLPFASHLLSCHVFLFFFFCFTFFFCHSLLLLYVGVFRQSDKDRSLPSTCLLHVLTLFHFHGSKKCFAFLTHVACSTLYNVIFEGLLFPSNSQHCIFHPTHMRDTLC